MTLAPADAAELAALHDHVALWAARRFASGARGVDRADAIQAARVAVLEAARRFAPGGRATFATYARKCAQFAIYGWLRGHLGHGTTGYRPADPRPLVIGYEAPEGLADRPPPTDAPPIAAAAVAHLRLALPADEFAVLWAVHVEGRDLAEAADALGLTPVRAWLVADQAAARARRALPHWVTARAGASACAGPTDLAPGRVAR